MKLPSLTFRFVGMGLRPRLACELRPSGIVAACAPESSGLIAATSSASLPHGAYSPSLRTGSIANPATFVDSLRSALDLIAPRARDLTLIVPDSAARVLLLDFDSLPSRASEALPIIIFRLKKLLPFEPEHAAVSYQVMSSANDQLRVLAAALPRELVEEYESAARDAGYLPGSILPSTLAALPLLPAHNASPALLINANPYAFTSAIVRNGVLELHRTLDFTESLAPLPEDAPIPALPPAASAPRDVSPEIAQAVSIAAAYFEDTLGVAPTEIISIGSIDAASLTQMIADGGYSTPPIRDAVSPSLLLTEAASANTPRSLLAGVAGSLATGEEPA